MGDSMNQARAFMRNCQTALFDMAASDEAMSSLELSDPARLNTDVFVSALTAIQSGAKLNHALAIYRAAQQALNAIESPEVLAGRIERLSYLISQYETGLLELEMETTAQDTSGTLETDDAEAPNLKIYYLSDEVRQARAERALKETLNLASRSERPALETLLSHSMTPVIEASEPELSALPETMPAKSEPAPSVKRPDELKAAQIDLENLIQDIIQLSLTVARQHGLTLSLSYDMAGETIDDTQADRFKMRMCQWMTYLIRHIAASQTAEALAESMAHIDISATANEISLSTLTSDLPVSSEATLPDPTCVRPFYDAVENRLSLHITYRAKATLENKRKPETVDHPKMPIDEGIAARLDALLAGNSHLIAFEPKRATS